MTLCLLLTALVCGIASAQAPAPRSPLESPLEVETGTTSESLSNGYTPWRSSHLGLSRKLGERRTLYGSLTQTERFSLTDQQITAGLYQPLGCRATFLIEGGLSPTHRVTATDTLLGEIDWPLERGWVVDFGLRHSDYAQAHANLETLTAERYFGPYHAAWTVYAAGLPGSAQSLSHRVQIGWFYTERSSISLAGSFGTDLETLGPGRVGAVAVKEYDLSGRHWITPRWGISYAIGFQRQGNRYDKKELTVGLSTHL